MPCSRVDFNRHCRHFKFCNIWKNNQEEKEITICLGLSLNIKENKLSSMLLVIISMQHIL